MSLRAVAKLFREIWPLIQRHVPEDDYRAEFVCDLIDFFQRHDSHRPVNESSPLGLGIGA